MWLWLITEHTEALKAQQMELLEAAKSMAKTAVSVVTDLSGGGGEHEGLVMGAQAAVKDVEDLGRWVCRILGFLIWLSHILAA